MACNCKNELEAKMVEVLKVEHPEAENHQASLDSGYAFTISENSMRMVGKFQFENAITVTTKNGVKRTQKPKCGMFFTYCPFCGVKYNEDKPATSANEVQP